MRDWREDTDPFTLSNAIRLAEEVSKLEGCPTVVIHGADGKHRVHLAHDLDHEIHRGRAAGRVRVISKGKLED